MHHRARSSRHTPKHQRVARWIGSLKICSLRTVRSRSRISPQTSPVRIEGVHFTGLRCHGASVRQRFYDRCFVFRRVGQLRNRCRTGCARRTLRNLPISHQCHTSNGNRCHQPINDYSHELNLRSAGLFTRLGRPPHIISSDATPAEPIPPRDSKQPVARNARPHAPQSPTPGRRTGPAGWQTDPCTGRSSRRRPCS